MANSGKKLAKNDGKWRLTSKNLKFLQNLMKGMKVPDAHRLAGYSGNAQASYALKNSLKAHLAKLFENEGVSRDRYLADLLELLKLPCVDKHGNKISALSFDQYVAVRKLLKEELPSTKPASHNITAFVIQRYDSDSVKDQDKVIDITPISGRSSNTSARPSEEG